MYDLYFVFQSLTETQQALWELRNYGIHSSLIRIPRKVSPDGCRYGLMIDHQLQNNAIAIFNKSGIHFKMVIPNSGSML